MSVCGCKRAIVNNNIFLTDIIDMTG